MCTAPAFGLSNGSAKLAGRLRYESKPADLLSITMALGDSTILDDVRLPGRVEFDRLAITPIA